jgi:hypothetical protein
MVATIQRRILGNSNISAFFINKQVIDAGDDSLITGNRFNRIGGIEYNLYSSDNRWTGKAFYHQQFHEDAGFDDAVIAANIKYSSQYITAILNQAIVGAGYLAETGYVRRTGYYEINPAFQYKFFPHESSVANHGPGLKLDMFFDPKSSFSLTDRETQLLYSIEWMNRNSLSVDVKETFIRLRAPYDPTNTGGPKLLLNKKFYWNEVGATFMSDNRKLFNVILTGRYGGYYNGTRLTLNGELNYRVQPYGSLALVTTYNNISLPEPYNSARLLLIGPKLDFTFTDKLFFTSFIQYNNQIDNLNINLRFQWRFAPVSDLFIVYTENSFPADYSIKNRGLVIKLSYWFN